MSLAPVHESHQTSFFEPIGATFRNELPLYVDSEVPRRLLKCAVRHDTTGNFWQGYIVGNAMSLVATTIIATELAGSLLKAISLTGVALITDGPKGCQERIDTYFADVRDRLIVIAFVISKVVCSLLFGVRRLENVEVRAHRTDADDRADRLAIENQELQVIVNGIEDGATIQRRFQELEGENAALRLAMQRGDELSSRERHVQGERSPELVAAETERNEANALVRELQDAAVVQTEVIDNLRVQLGSLEQQLELAKPLQNEVGRLQAEQQGQKVALEEAANLRRNFDRYIRHYVTDPKQLTNLKRQLGLGESS